MVHHRGHAKKKTHRVGKKLLQKLGKRLGRRSIGTQTKTCDKEESLATGTQDKMGQRYYTIQLQKPPKRGQFSKDNITYSSTNYALMSAGNTGVIGSCPVLYLGTTSQFLINTGGSYNIEQSDSSWISLNPYQTNTGSGIYGSLLQPMNDRIFLKHLTLDLEYRNLGLDGATVWIYVVQFKHDVLTAVDNPINIINNINAQDSIGNSAAAPATGVLGFEGSGYPFFAPTDNKDFKKMFKVLKVHKADVQSGSQERLTFNVKYNKLFSVVEFTAKNPYLVTVSGTTETLGAANVNSNLSVNHVKGTVAVFAFARGAILRDSALGAKVTTGACEIAFISNYKAKFKVPVASLRGPINVANTNLFSEAPTTSTLKFPNVVDTLTTPNFI